MRYEVAIKHETRDIVWVNGPFLCGSHPDVTIYRNGTKFELARDEREVADKGYTDDACLTPGTVLSHIPTALLSFLRARHETVNKRHKQFCVLNSHYGHPLSFRGYCFQALARITQLVFKRDPLFNVKF